MVKLSPKEKQRLKDDLAKRLDKEKIDKIKPVVKEVSEKQLKILKKFTRTNKDGYIETGESEVPVIDKGEKEERGT